MNSVTTHKGHKKEYFIVFLVLGFLTIAEIMCAESSIDYAVRAATLVGLALLKAWVVAYYYMHLKDETRWLKIIAAVPLAAFLYAGVLLAELTAR